ncbi:MAG: relaxase domain-containing protein, partial [Chloroflexi bacterium]|nr:relaxase domain-containing protein [Chloroflexota bacterium]
MQTISQAATAEYYLESQQSYRSNTLYYTTGEEPDGVWWNPNALFSEYELIDGEQINNTAFGNLYNGMSPDGGDKLTRNAGSKDRSSGIDLTFSVDKSVSTLWAIADPALREAIEKCHNDAARHALNSIYKKMVSYTRRGQKGAEVLKADILGAMFQHGSSRENDPQLHTHCMIFNVAKTVDDGKWRALHQAPFYRWTKASGAVYRHALAWKLQQDLGIRIERYGQDDQFVRIVGMPEDLMKYWSKRHSQIVAAAQEKGIVLGEDAQRDAAVVLATRASKETDSDPNLRSARFLKEAERFIDREQVIENVLGSFKELDAANLQDVVKVCKELPKQLTVHEAVFRLTDLIEQIAKNTAGDVQPEAIQTLVSRVIGLDEVVLMDQTEPTPEASAQMAHTTLYSTMTEITEEHEIAEYGRELLSRNGYACDKEAIDAMIDMVDSERDFNLAKEQRDAIHHLAGVDGGVSILEGAAGSGKTSVLRPVTDLYKAKGYNVIAAATAWRVANDLGDGCKINRYSVAAMLQKTGTGKMVLDDKTVVLIDEAGQLSVRQMHRLLKLADTTGAKFVFVGDLKQQQAIEAGPGLRLLKEEAVTLLGKEAGSAVLASMRRQKLDIEDLLVITKGMSPESARLQESFMSPEERREVLKERDRLPPQKGWMNKASRNFKEQKAIEGIKAYAERGRFKMCRGVDDTYITLVEDWHKYRQANPGHSTLVMARTNLQVNELALRLRERHLSDEDRQHSVSISTSKGLSGKRDVQTLEVARGDILKIGTTVWEKRLFNGTLITVTDIKTAFGAAMDGTDRHHIRAIDNNGREIAFFSDEIKDYYGNVRLDYGYAMTISMAQGAEAHAAFGLMDDRLARESAYVVVTRHQESLHMYADRTLIAGTIVDRRPEDEWNKPVTDEDCHQYLGPMWSREGDKVAAFDYASDGQAEELIGRIAEQRDEQKVQNLTEMLRGMGGITVDHDQSSDTGNQASQQAQNDDSDAAASGILAQLMRRNSVFTLRQLRGVVHGEGYRKDEMDAVVRGVLRDKRVMPLYGVDSDQLNPSFTTTSVYAEERKLVETARSLSGQTTDLSLGRIKSSLARSVKNHDLDQEQT